jgi:hypothetical protein
METGFRGTFVISWSQTEVDGLRAASTDMLSVGAAWRWSGDAVRVDGPAELLLLGGAKEVTDLRKRAARTVRRLVGAALQPKKNYDDIQIDDPVMDGGFVITDGRRTFTATLIEVGDDAPPLLMFLDEIPPAQTGMWVVSCSIREPVLDRMGGQTGGVICFTKGTKILTPDGPRLVEELGEGDRLQTKDDGGQEILWIGQRRMTGARLHAMPHLRPVRILAGALSEGEPDEDLLVSPDHRLLVKGPAANVLFNTPEVLVSAKDLVNDHDVLVEHGMREVTYIHLMLERHHVVWANGVETESFHPANTSLDTVEEGQRERLFKVNPSLEQDPNSYGGFVRRNLSPSEAEILKYDGVVHH